MTLPLLRSHRMVHSMHQAVVLHTHVPSAPCGHVPLAGRQAGRSSASHVAVNGRLFTSVLFPMRAPHPPAPPSSRVSNVVTTLAAMSALAPPPPAACALAPPPPPPPPLAGASASISSMNTTDGASAAAAAKTPRRPASLSPAAAVGYEAVHRFKVQGFQQRSRHAAPKHVLGTGGQDVRACRRACVSVNQDRPWPWQLPALRRPQTKQVNL